MALPAGRGSRKRGASRGPPWRRARDSSGLVVSISSIAGRSVALSLLYGATVAGAGRGRTGAARQTGPADDLIVIGTISHHVRASGGMVGDHLISSVAWSRVGYQGEPGAYSEEAALAALPDATTIGFPTFSRVFDAVASREIDAAVLPVENSLGGIVQEVNDLFSRLGARRGTQTKGFVL